MLTPTHDYRRLDYRVPPRVLAGLDAMVNRGVGIYQRRAQRVAKLREDAERIVCDEARWRELPDASLHERLMEFRGTFRRGGKLADEIVMGALGAIREASRRELGLHPFPVQLMGALALHRGFLAEMATGEGKTLTAGLAAVLAGWTKRPCHVVTVNDYLVERDAAWLRPLYTVCGVTVGGVTAAMDPAARLKGYGCDVTYTTSKELLADFLRDRLRLGGIQNPTQRLIRRLLAPVASDGLVMRGLHTAIVDEADSLLIDEAVTPLIISAPTKNELLKEAGILAEQIAGALELESDYRANSRYKEIELTDSGRDKLAGRAGQLPGLWRGNDRRTELIRQALVAREFFQRDKHYIIVDGKIVIVDESTGRPMPQRTWREGVHQAIEAKEGLPLSDPSETIARLSFQRFFRCFHKLSGMTGTAREASGEFWQVYGLPVVQIPVNRPCVRQHWPDRFFATDAAKWNAVVLEIERLHRTGRPLLVGTRSVASSEKLALLLSERGLDFKLINATRLAEEAETVAMAGEQDRITIATNMAGRGTDIKLGAGVAEMGGLHVLATERHESGRVDRQLFGRAGRQGDPGSAQAFVSAEDELIRRFLPVSLQGVLRRSLEARFVGSTQIAEKAFSLAQRRAQQMAFKQRRAVLKADTWLEESLSFAGGDTV
ncbi:MAG: hypothetical protein HOP33_00065 [Verrucomicrobia bacterium]|nr:hypothetical protein [Verrucomicrobiota bacterium]